MNPERLDESLERLEAAVAKAEAQLRALSEENARLRAALEGRHSASEAADGGADGRPLRLVLLEAERDEIRSRIRSVIAAL